MLSRRKALPPLGELELAALDYLWRCAEADVTEIHAAIGRPRGIAVNTVGSALERLFKKGLAARIKVSHAYRYRAALSREALSARRVLEAAGGLGALADAGLLAAFVDLVADVDDAALERLERLIAQKRSQRGDA
jgi:predicted transcriptional regulator